MTFRICNVCGAEKPLDDFTQDSRRPDGRTRRCKSCSAKSANDWHKKNRDHHNKKMQDWRNKDKRQRPHRYLWAIAKRRAKEDGRAFSIVPYDLEVPEYCPVLGTKLQFGIRSYSPNSPSVDAIRPELGYIPGNVAVISHRANTIKQNASPDELRKVADWLEKKLQSAESSPVGPED